MGAAIGCENGRMKTGLGRKKLTFQDSWRERKQQDSSQTERRVEDGGIIRQPELLSPHVESGSGLGWRKTGKTDRRGGALQSTQEHYAGR